MRQRLRGHSCVRLDARVSVTLLRRSVRVSRHCVGHLVVCSPDSLDFYDGRYPDASKRPALSIFFASVPVLDGQSVTLEDDYRYNGDAVNASEARVGGCESVRDSSLSVVDGGVTRQGVAAAVACLAVAAVAAGVAVTMYRERPRAASQARSRGHFSWPCRISCPRRRCSLSRCVGVDRHAVRHAVDGVCHRRRRGCGCDGDAAAVRIVSAIVPRGVAVRQRDCRS